MNTSRNGGSQRGAANQPPGMTPEEWTAYQRYIDAQLPTSPLKGLVGLCIAAICVLVFFMFPSFISWLQDEGLIRPRLHLRLVPGAYQEPGYGRQRMD